MHGTKKNNICLISSQKIRYFSKDRKITMRELAQHLGIKERALFNKLNYTSCFSDTEVLILTSLFKCNREDISKSYSELSNEELAFCKKFNIIY